MLLKRLDGKSLRIPMGWATHGMLGHLAVQIKAEDLGFLPEGTVFRQVNQHKEKNGKMARVPEMWLQVIKGGYSLGDV